MVQPRTENNDWLYKLKLFFEKQGLFIGSLILNLILMFALIHIWGVVAALRQFDNKISVIGDFEKRLVKNFDQLNSGVQNRLAMTDQEIRANTNSISQIKIDIGIVLGELKEFSAELSTYNQNNNEQDGLATTNPIPLHSTSNAAVQKNVKSRGITSSNKTVFQRMERADGKIEYHRIY